MPADTITLDIPAMSEALLVAPQTAGDSELLLRAGAGEAEAFECLLLRYQQLVLRTALRFLADRNDARDAAQDVFLRLYRHLKRIDLQRPLAPWLYRVTIHICYDMERRRKGRPARTAFEWIESIAEPESRESDPGRELLRREEWRALQQALLTLPEKERAAFLLRDIEELSTAEVARILDTSEVTVRSHICRARVKIKQALEQRWGRKP